jgi:hypothetical protein
MFTPSLVYFGLGGFIVFGDLVFYLGIYFWVPHILRACYLSTTWSPLPFLAYFPYFEKMKVGLCNHPATCMSACL